MRFDLDTYKEILDTITRNKSRSLLTGFGVFWGVFMLIVLMGGGQGLKELLQANFSGFATNTAVIWAQNTTKPYKGFNKGRSWQMEEKDLERLRQLLRPPSVPDLFRLKQKASSIRRSPIMTNQQKLKQLFKLLEEIDAYGRSNKTRSGADICWQSGPPAG